MKVTEEERHAQRLANVSAWLDVIEDSARELEQEVLSRTSETASEAGADPDPRVVLCRHPASARMGRLCLLCDNTGFASAREVEGERVDPYLVDPPREVWAVRRDESDSARRARNAERLDAIIASLQRDARLRAGVEVREDELRYVRVISRIGSGVRARRSWPCWRACRQVYAAACCSATRSRWQYWHLSCQGAYVRHSERASC
jgi:hypothetical protein